MFLIVDILDRTKGAQASDDWVAKRESQAAEERESIQDKNIERYASECFANNQILITGGYAVLSHASLPMAFTSGISLYTGIYSA